MRSKCVPAHASICYKTRGLAAAPGAGPGRRREWQHKVQGDDVVVVGDRLRGISLGSSGDPIIHMWIMDRCVCRYIRAGGMAVCVGCGFSLSRSPSRWCPRADAVRRGGGHEGRQRFSVGPTRRGRGRAVRCGGGREGRQRFQSALPVAAVAELKHFHMAPHAAARGARTRRRGAQVHGIWIVDWCP